MRERGSKGLGCAGSTDVGIKHTPKRGSESDLSRYTSPGRSIKAARILNGCSWRRTGCTGMVLVVE